MDEVYGYDIIISSSEFFIHMPQIQSTKGPTHGQHPFTITPKYLIVRIRGKGKNASIPRRQNQAEQPATHTTLACC